MGIVSESKDKKKKKKKVKYKFVLYFPFFTTFFTH